jgi:hypothetical protein
VLRIRASQARPSDQATSPPTSPIWHLYVPKLVTVLRRGYRWEKRCRQAGTRVILSGLREQPREVLKQMNLTPGGVHLCFADDFRAAVRLASSPD